MAENIEPRAEKTSRVPRIVTHDPKAAKSASVVRHLDKGLLLPLSISPGGGGVGSD
ncbi:MAG: hypothetical protein NTW68_07500 [candidate division NC10 bacterium]|nr:hypothetical protein [candidate division NC10 bacterium]